MEENRMKSPWLSDKEIENQSPHTGDRPRLKLPLAVVLNATGIFR